MLYIFSGLPGTGKSTLSSALAQAIRAAYLRADVVEQAMWEAGTSLHGPEGYMVCYAIASQHLRLGLDVVSDSVNPIRVTREAWRGVAEAIEAPFVEIEVVCSDEREHRHRVETRTVDIPNLVLPTWEQVVNREYEKWDRDRIVIDTAHQTAAESFMHLREQLDRIRIPRGGR